MTEQNNSDSQSLNQQTSQEKKPNEKAGFFFSSFLKITDPNTKQVLVQTRAD